jgi:PAS domain S-box-containing protein
MTKHDELSRLQSQHQLILDSAGEGIYGLDHDGKITFSNAAATEILGWRLADVLGQVAHDVHHHSHADGSPYLLGECLIHKAFKDGEVHRVDDEVFWHIDGHCVPVEYTSTPIFEDGEPCGVVVVFRDISERKEIEQQRQTAYDELVRVQQQQQLILDAAGEGIYGLAADGGIAFGNAASEAILGWRAEDIHGRKAHDVHHHSHEDGSNYPVEQCPIYAALKDGEIHRVDNEVFWHTNGNPVPVDYTSTPILVNGKPNGAVVVFRDVTVRKNIERQREAAYAEIKVLKEQLEQERDYLRDEVEVTISHGDIIGDSPALRRTLAKVEAVAATSANVLILGESGVGKEMIARAIHCESGRNDKPLIKVNCASIPKELFESEFFGHIRGAFTGAHKDRIGRLQLANGGTLFLDEVGEIPLSLQGKLLRALQEQEFERVGDDETTTVDVRVVAATNRNLEEEVAAGRFREDLYYRLSVFPMELPPLRERVDDIVPLASHFLDTICAELGREPLALTKQQSLQLKKQQWSGNIRELKNVMERAVILTKGSRLRLDLAMGGAGISPIAAEPEIADTSPFMTEEEFRAKEKQNLIAALHAADWRVWGPDGAAAMLGIKPSTLSYRMNAFSIEKSP